MSEVADKEQDFKDGAHSVFNQITNDRNILNTSDIKHKFLTREQMQAHFLSGLGSRIIRIKSSYALENTIDFQSTEQEDFYEKRLRKCVLKAVQYMIGFGRGIIVLFNPGDDLSKPIGKLDRDKAIIRVFAGDSVQAVGVSLDIADERFYKPLSYSVSHGNGIIHHSRVIDFTYFEPTEMMAPYYQYGGVSEFELIHDSLVANAVVHRAGANILERSAGIVYRLTGFKSDLQTNREEFVRKYISETEKHRTLTGATIIDKDDDVAVLTQQIQGYAEIEASILRSVAADTSIPYPLLVGQSVQGLNSTGGQERQSFQEANKSVQNDFILPKINDTLAMFNFGQVSFKESQGVTPMEQALYEKTCIENAVGLDSMQEDANAYLVEKGVVVPDLAKEFFESDEEDGESYDVSKSLVELFSNQQEMPDELQKKINDNYLDLLAK